MNGMGSWGEAITLNFSRFSCSQCELLENFFWEVPNLGGCPRYLKERPQEAKRTELELGPRTRDHWGFAFDREIRLLGLGPRGL